MYTIMNINILKVLQVDVKSGRPILSPYRHSSEGWDPGCSRKPWRHCDKPAWIPALAGKLVGRREGRLGNCSPVTWPWRILRQAQDERFCAWLYRHPTVIPVKAGIQDACENPGVIVINLRGFSLLRERRGWENKRATQQLFTCDMTLVHPSTGSGRAVLGSARLT